MSFLDNISKTLSDVGQSTIQKGRGVVDAAKYNSLIAEEEKKIIGIYEQLGRKYVEEFGKEPADSLAEYITALKESKDRIAQYQQKLEEIKGITKCLGCGAEIPSGSSFCSVCGAKAAPPPSEQETVVYCMACGAVLPAHSKFCTSCGNPLA